MVGEILLSLLAIVVAYLLGSIPSAYLIGRWLKGMDIREAGDGRLGAAAVRRRAGLVASIIVAIMDVGKGMAAVYLAKVLGLPLGVVAAVGLAAVVGHNWSLFLRFQGGKGALVTFGVLASLMLWPLLIAMAISGIVLILTNGKTGFASGVVFFSLALFNLFLGSPIVLVIMPILIGVPMFLKHLSMPKTKVAVAAGVESQKKGQEVKP
jgi:glycerol-3-phosphate acyltransferase PlsY